jgi:hypothetical protein
MNDRLAEAIDQLLKMNDQLLVTATLQHHIVTISMMISETKSLYIFKDVVNVWLS